MSRTENAEFESGFLSDLRHVLLNNDKLVTFINSFSFGEISSARYYPTRKVVFNKDGNSIFDTSVAATTEIRICPFSPKNIGLETGTIDKMHQKMYGNYWKDYTTAKKLGINVSPKAKIKGYLLAFSDVKLAAAADYAIFNKFNEIYYLGEKNILLGVASVDGFLYLRYQAIIKLMQNNDSATIRKTLKNLLTCFYNTKRKYEEINIRQFREELAELVQDGVFSRVVNADEYSGNYYNRYGTPNSQKEFLDTVKAYIKDNISQALNDTCFGINDAYSYSRAISEIMSSRSNQDKTIFKEGFEKGMRIGMKLELLGWHPVNPNFADDTSASVNIWWKKDVTIIPNTFISGAERYEIPVSHRKSKITELFINQNGKMRCTGEHPNVNGTNVCMGDLKIELSDKVSNIQDQLQRAEELLDIINFDSAYHREQKDKLLAVSTKIKALRTATYEDEDAVKKYKVREVKFDDSDDSDEEVVIETPNARTQTIVRNGEPVASLVENILEIGGIPVNRYSPDENRLLDSEDVSEQTVEYIISDDVDVLEDIRNVTADGTRRPAIFVTGAGNIVNPHPVVNNVDVRELVLGDSNLI